MSDFVKTMRDWKRMCYAFSKQYGYDCCQYCRLHQKGCEAILLQIQESAYDTIAETVYAWAAENPEPQYPTWLDYLHTLGLVIKTENCTTYGFDFTKARNPTPADIAEKLGLKPKGGNEND